MSLEQTKKIIEAAGECWHELSEKSNTHGRCIKCDSWFHIFDRVALSEPYYDYLLIGYVKKICDTDEKQSIFGSKLFSLVVEHEKWRKGLYPLQSGFYFATASNEAIMTALCRVIDEDQ